MPGGDASLGSRAAGGSGAGGAGTLQSPQKKTLVKYDPNSKRNRMPVYFGVEAQQGVCACAAWVSVPAVLSTWPTMAWV